ncbi:MAG: rhomboid family intramembrane serine protease [Nitrososphaerota archaeon]
MQFRSPVTFTVIGLNVIIWLAINIFLTDIRALNIFLLNFGVVPILLLNNVNYISLISHMFIHVNIFHILLNMYALFLFGRELEELIGVWRFILLYMMSGVVAAVFHILYFVIFLSVECSPYLRPLPAVCVSPAIGASGAIFGIMAGYAVFFPRRRLYALMWFIPVVAPAYVVILGYAAVQTLFMLTTPFSTIAYTAHVGGFIAGLVISAIYRLSRGSRYLMY